MTSGLDRPDGDDASPLVSICIPTYKGAAHLAATIESVLAQTYRRFELWIVDDASRDGTADVVARYDDPRVHWVPNEANLGPEGNWNRSASFATGKYYKLLPQDDLLERTALEEQVGILERDEAETLVLVFGSRMVIDYKGRGLVRRGLPPWLKGRIRGADLVRRCVRSGTNMIGEPGNGLMRTSLATRVGAYDARFPYMVDLDFWFRALALGDAFYTGTRSSSFRVSQGSWSVALGRAQLADFKGFIDRYAATPGYHIAPGDVRLGYAKARINTFGRALIYRSLFMKR